MADYNSKSQNIVAARELPELLSLADFSAVIAEVVTNGITNFTIDTARTEVKIKTPIVAKTAGGIVMCTIYDTFDSATDTFLSDIATVVNAAVGAYDNNSTLKTALGEDFDHFDIDLTNAVYAVSFKGAYHDGGFEDKAATVQFKRDAVYFRNLNNEGIAEALDEWCDTVDELAQSTE